MTHPRCICKCILINIATENEEPQWFCPSCHQFWNEVPRVEPTDQDYDLREFEQRYMPRSDE